MHGTLSEQKHDLPLQSRLGHMSVKHSINWRYPGEHTPEVFWDLEGKVFPFRSCYDAAIALIAASSLSASNHHPNLAVSPPPTKSPKRAPPHKSPAVQRVPQPASDPVAKTTDWASKQRHPHDRPTAHTKSARPGPDKQTNNAQTTDERQTNVRRVNKRQQTDDHKSGGRRRVQFSSSSSSLALLAGGIRRRDRIDHGVVAVHGKQPLTPQHTKPPVYDAHPRPPHHLTAHSRRALDHTSTQPPAPPAEPLAREERMASSAYPPTPTTLALARRAQIYANQPATPATHRSLEEHTRKHEEHTNTYARSPQPVNMMYGMYGTQHTRDDRMPRAMDNSHGGFEVPKLSTMYIIFVVLVVQI
ncbi:hypothetical protein BD410DRAFT_810510 [Rickenella mellea]|uniref:Uncharacterized protein n=1 Tax=Rickenella mellea TaxID=50990 RepID=A0A4Y7PDS2_9AGAM|nr:hypothetical protein BD410DRAFT_810510 [Rickenella mellea]